MLSALPVGIVDFSTVHDVPAVRAELLGDDDKKSPQSIRLSSWNSHLHCHFFSLTGEVSGWERKSLDLNLLHLKVSAGVPLAKTGQFLGKRSASLGEFNLDAFNVVACGAHP